VKTARTSTLAATFVVLLVYAALPAQAAARVTEYPVGFETWGMTAGPDGNVWFTAAFEDAVGKITPGGGVTVYPVPTHGAAVGSITTGPDGNLWFTEGLGDKIGRITPAGDVTEYPLPSPSSGPAGITAGPDGNLWFTESTPSAIGMINPTTHAITEFSAGLNAGSRPGASIVVGPDGALWFMDGGTTQAIGRIDPTTHAITEFSVGLSPGAALGRVAVGPDGSLWFGDKGTSKAIYVMNPTTHAITAFAAGLNPGSAPGGISSGPDGNVWFTDQGTTKALGRIGVGAAAASVTAPSVGGSGGVNLPHTCGGDLWSTWAGQQPSHAAYVFDGYQWLLDGSAITGGTGPSYTPTAADAGHQLSCKATVTYPLLVVTASATSSAVHVEGAAEQLGDLADAVVGVGPGRSLAAKVSEIQGNVAANDTAEACAALGAFINEVDAQTGKKISADEASSLVTQAHNIEAALDC